MPRKKNSEEYTEIPVLDWTIKWDGRCWQMGKYGTMKGQPHFTPEFYYGSVGDALKSVWLHQGTKLGKTDLATYVEFMKGEAEKIKGLVKAELYDKE